MPKSTVNASRQTLCPAIFHTRLRPLRLVGLTVAKSAYFTNSSKKFLSRTSFPRWRTVSSATAMTCSTHFCWQWHVVRAKLSGRGQCIAHLANVHHIDVISRQNWDEGTLTRVLHHNIRQVPFQPLCVSKAVAEDLQKRVAALQAEIDQARLDRQTLLDRFVAEQEEAFKEKERKGLETLQDQRRDLESKVEMHEKSVFFQRAVESRVQKELGEINAQIAKESADRKERLEQALTADKAQLDKTDVSQPAIFVASMAAVEKLRAEDPAALEAANMAMGLSLGEYTALAFAGAISFEDGVKITKARGDPTRLRQSEIATTGPDA